MIPLVAILASAAVYGLGVRNGTWSRRSRVRACWFAAGLLALAAALVSPLSAYDDRLFWAHMTQHVLLLAVAPPLILLGWPGVTSWRALPLDVRRRWARGVLPAPVAPPVALGLFVANMAAWHVPALYDATLASPAIHELEHVLFLATGLLFWSCVIDSPPLRSRLTLPERGLYAFVAMLACWVLALVLGLGTSPLYSAYAELQSRPGGLSALADQHLAAGIMWVPGSIPFVLAIALCAYRWLDDGARKRGPAVAEAAR